MKQDAKNRLRRSGRFFLAAYLACLIYFMFFSEAYGRTDINPEYRYNLVLFREIRRFWVHRDILGTSVMLINIVGNVAIFIPIGFLLPLLFPKTRRAGVTVAGTFFASLLAETCQLLLRVGCFDVDDLLLNTLGGMLGYLLFACLRRIRRKKHVEETL